MQRLFMLKFQPNRNLVLFFFFAKYLHVRSIKTLWETF